MLLKYLDTQRWLFPSILIQISRHFRLQKWTFELLCQHLNLIHERPAVHTRGKEKISLDKQLLITLWVLGNPECLRSVADRFGVTESTVYTCYKDMCQVISTNLMSAFIVWPISSEQRTKEIIDRFNGVPNCIGCIDGCHIPIKGPRFKREDYINRKGYASIILQAVCDSEYLFTDIHIGWPGSVHDARVLRNSPLYEDATNNRDAVFPRGTWRSSVSSANVVVNKVQRQWCTNSNRNQIQQKYVSQETEDWTNVCSPKGEV